MTRSDATSRPRRRPLTPGGPAPAHDAAPDAKAGGAYQQLYDLVLDGTIAPGARLKEAELAERFGLSRTPVREALRRLESQGLAVHEAHKGMVVATLEPQAVAELYAMREALEGTAAALAAAHASAIEIGVLHELIEEDRRHVHDAARMARANRAFHSAIHASARNRYLTQSIKTLHEAMALLGPTTLARSDRAAQSLDEHQAIVDAIARHDAAAAEDLARQHVRAAFAERLRLNARRIAEREPGASDEV